jgi:NAD(P)-dependent dehydrogenase (short-subunit alcohol dehydrogenase family)
MRNSQPDMAQHLFDLTGQTAVVIGATGVLVGALAEGLAQAGARAAVLGRNAERGQQRMKAIQAAGGQAVFVEADALHPASLRVAHQAVEKALGTPSILLNAAIAPRQKYRLPAP